MKKYVISFPILDNDVSHLVPKLTKIFKNFVTTRPAHGVPGTFSEGPLKILTFGTYRGPSGDPQGTDTETDNLMKKLLFRSNSPCIT